MVSSTKGPNTRSKTTTNSLRLEMKKIAQGNKKYIDMQTLKNIADHLYPVAGNHGYIPARYDRKDLKVKVSVMKPLFKNYLNVRNRTSITNQQIKESGRVVHDTIMEVLAKQVLYPNALSTPSSPKSKRYRSPTPTLISPRSPPKLKKRRVSSKK